MTETTSTTGPADRELVITRVFDAPRELVFRAWTDPARLAQWWGPRNFTAPSVDLDLTEGGRWRTCIRSEADGTEYWSRGVYREIVAPERLVFTFAWEEPEGSPGTETLVTVVLDDEGDRTRMTFHHAAFSSAKERDSHEEGWAESFDDLAAVLAPATRSARR